MGGEQGRLPAVDDLSAEFRRELEGDKGRGYIPRETAGLTISQLGRRKAWRVWGMQADH